MTPPLLKLAFAKGPRDGESLEYKPGSTIRIGRVVRGNEIAIKDGGISTKHLRIDSDSEKWIIHDLGSSNGTTLNSETLDPDTPVTLSHGDEIKLGEYTSIVVSFETDVQAEEEEEKHKLPPKPRRTTRRRPDPEPIPVQDKPTRKGRSAKQEEPEQLKRTTRATRSKVAIAKEEEEAVAVEKKGNSKARGGKKNAEAVLDSIKLEIEDTPKGVEIPAMKRATRSSRRQIGNVKSEDTGLEEMRMSSRTTRSKRKEIGGDSYLELEMVLSQARAKKKKVEQKGVVEEMEARNEDVEEDKENEKGVSETSDKEDEDVEEGKEDEKGVSEASDKEDKVPKRVVEIESRKSTLGEEDVEQDKENEIDGSDTSDKDDETSKIESGKSTFREDGEEKNLQDAMDNKERRDCKTDGVCDEEEEEEEEEKGEEESRNVEKVDLEKMTLGDWFKYMEVYLRKKIVDETEEMIEGMRAKSRRVHQYIAEEQKKGKEKDV